jgi:hypothetical protein
VWPSARIVARDMALATWASVSAEQATWETIAPICSTAPIIVMARVSASLVLAFVSLDSLVRTVGIL